MANYENSGEDSCLANLPKQTWFGAFDLYQWQGFWLVAPVLKTMMSTQTLQFFPADIVLASTPKSGTTWLKALVLSITNRELAADDPLLTHNPHQLVPFLELQTPDDKFFSTQKGRRIFATHLPYQLLPESVKNSGCRIVYITRNPRDTFVSSWHFASSQKDEPPSMEDGFESFCRGVSLAGPFFDHVLGYWKEREKVHFVTYEDLREDPREQVKKLAQFLGCTLNSEEEVDAILWRCSHERLSKLEVNKRPDMVEVYGFKSCSFFRRGVVGDWKNYLTAEMIERLDAITLEKLKGKGLRFQVSGKTNSEA